MKLTPERRNVLLLSSTQALFQTVSVMIMTLSGLVGQKLASDKSLATLPIALMVVATATMMIPASLLMQRHGRKAGFLLGALAGGLTGVLGAYAIWIGSFWLFVVANMLVGFYQAFAQYYRFAAAEVASEEFRSRAISWVIAGGVIAAVAGPNLARLTQGLGPSTFAVSYLAMSVLALIAAFLIAGLRLPPVTVPDLQGTARPLLEILRQPVFLTAIAASAIGYAVMIMVMTATPLAMQMHSHSIDSAATVIQWHVLGMFVPSFFTGNLIRRFGVLSIMSAGIVMLAVHVAIALSGMGLAHFLSGLILVGVGWNFLFIGGTTLLIEAYRPAERAKTQAAHDFLMFGAVGIASFSSGSLLNHFGWDAVNFTVLPLLALPLAMIVSLSHLRRRQVLA